MIGPRWNLVRRVYKQDPFVRTNENKPVPKEDFDHSLIFSARLNLIAKECLRFQTKLSHKRGTLKEETEPNMHFIIN